MTVAECYRVLGLEPGSSKDQISKAYRKLALQYHPDHHPEDDSAQDFIRITEAYHLLIGSKKQQLNNASGKNHFYQNQTYSRSQTDEAREKAKAWARMKYEEAARKSEELEKASIHSFLWPRYWNYFFLALALISIIDSILPTNKIVCNDTQRLIIRYNPPLFRVCNYELYTENEIEASVIEKSPVIIARTPLFKRLSYFYFEDDTRVNRPFAAFPNLLFIPALLAILALLVLYLPLMKLEHKIALKFIMVIVLLIFSIAWLAAP